MKIKEDREHWLRRVMVILFAFHFSLLTSSAQDDKSTMFNPVEHAVISQTIAPDARGAGMGDVGVATDPDVSSRQDQWRHPHHPYLHLGHQGQWSARSLHAPQD